MLTVKYHYAVVDHKPIKLIAGRFDLGNQPRPFTLLNYHVDKIVALC